MNALKAIVLLGAMGSITACTALESGEGNPFTGIGPDKSIDRGVDEKQLSNLVAGIWVDPNGCDHWIIDDGVEGYLSERLQPDGTPVCSGVAPPNTATGPFKEGSRIPDTL